MSHYVDGFVLVVQKKNVKAFMAMSKMVGKIYMKNGALAYSLCVGDDLKDAWVSLPFPKMMSAKPNEVVILQVITFKSKAQRDKVNDASMADPYMRPENWKGKPSLTDGKRMAYGGFKTLVEL
jgi:uncharacterized protein YbaA (DUF1428 family)